MPSAYLLRLNRRASPNVVVEGGSEHARIEAVRALHATSPLHGRPFCVVHGARDHDRLQRSLMHWLGQADGPPPFDCDGGMLYVDDPAELSPFVQRMLVDHGKRSHDLGVLDGGSPPPVSCGPVRLAAGSRRDLRHDVASGRLLPALHDALDIFHLRLRTPRRARAR